MSPESVFLFRIYLITFILCCRYEVTDAQVDAGTLSDEISKRSELQRFAAWLVTTRLNTFFDGEKQFTLFAPNNTAFEMMPKNRMDAIIGNVQLIDDYIKSYAIADQIVLTSGIRDNTFKRSYHGTKIYFARPRERAGVYEYYVNGAHIVNKDIRCANGVLHIVGQLTDQPSNGNVWDYIKQPSLPFLNIRFLYKYQSDSSYKSLHDIKLEDKITMFIPNNEALSRITGVHRSRLENKAELDQVLHRCYIKDKAIMTSWVRHKDIYRSASPSLEENIGFRKLIRDGIEKVYVHSGGVSAAIVYGNITVNNGVIHIVDRMLGYTYNSAREEIGSSMNFRTTKFNKFLANAPRHIQSAFNEQITVFVPTDEAFERVKKFAPWFDLNSSNNQQIIIELHMLQLGLTVNVLLENVEFENRATFESQYRRKFLSVYARYDLSFVEGGYVRSRIIGPDVGVTNGVIQYIDRVLGVPVRDIPGVMCEDNWLRSSYEAIRETGLLAQLTDCRLVSMQQKCTSIYSLDLKNEAKLGYRYLDKPTSVTPCGALDTPKGYTFLVPNGTAIDTFRRDKLNRVIWENKESYRRILKRHMIPKVIYLDQLSVGLTAYRNMIGEVITIRKNIFRVATYEVNFPGRSAVVLQADLGATNGVIHIINTVLYTNEDKGINSAPRLHHRSTTALLFGVCLILLACL